MNDYLDSCEIYVSAADQWISTAPMAEKRCGHTATLLPDGGVLVVGGFNGRNTAACELYDTAAGSWSDAGRLATPRDRHTATRLPDGRVFVAGGFSSGSVTGVVEIYDPATNSWSVGPALPEPRAYHTATMIGPSGILFTAGENHRINLNTADIFDFVKATWRSTGTLSIPHAYGQTATFLDSGRVLVAGGEPNEPEGGVSIDVAEEFDPETESWRVVAPMSTPRDFHTASMLESGEVLVAGGWASKEGGRPLNTAEIYSPAAETWRLTAPMHDPRAQHEAVTLPDNRVIVVGGRGRREVTAAVEAYTLVD